jgi:hypothetical protein
MAAMVMVAKDTVSALVNTTGRASSFARLVPLGYKPATNP